MRTPQLLNTPLKSLLRDLQSEDRKTGNAALKELRRRFVAFIYALCRVNFPKLLSKVNLFSLL